MLSEFVRFQKGFSAVECLGDNRTLAVRVAKVHKFFTSVFTAFTNKNHKVN